MIFSLFCFLRNGQIFFLFSNFILSVYISCPSLNINKLDFLKRVALSCYNPVQEPNQYITPRLKTFRSPNVVFVFHQLAYLLTTNQELSWVEKISDYWINARNADEKTRIICFVPSSISDASNKENRFLYENLSFFFQRIKLRHGLNSAVVTVVRVPLHCWGDLCETNFGHYFVIET